MSSPLPRQNRFQRLIHGEISPAEYAAELRREAECLCMGGTADCDPPFGPNGGCSRSDDEDES